MISDVSTELPGIIEKGSDPTIAGLAAAILTVCFVKLPASRDVKALTPATMDALIKFIILLRNRWDNVPEVDGDAFYMAAALLQFCKRSDPTRWLKELAHANLLDTLIDMAPMLAGAQHSLGLSMALNLMLPFVRGNSAAKTQLLERGIIVLVRISIISMTVFDLLPLVEQKFLPFRAQGAKTCLHC